MNMEPFGKALIAIGLVVAIVGIVMLFGSKIGIGKLPGDFTYSKGNFTFYFPLATTILVSVLLSIIFSIFKKII